MTFIKEVNANASGIACLAMLTGKPQGDILRENLPILLQEITDSGAVNMKAYGRTSFDTLSAIASNYNWRLDKDASYRFRGLKLVRDNFEQRKDDYYRILKDISDYITPENASAKCLSNKRAILMVEKAKNIDGILAYN